MEYTFREIADAVNGRIISCHSNDYIQYCGYDSRILSNPSQTVFFAICSGHNFIRECWLKGVRSFVVDRKDSLENLSSEIRNEINLAVVDDSIKALQDLARFHREKFKLPVIAITGSNGKTVVKEWLYELLRDDYSIVRSPKSFNSQIGVPLSVLRIKAGHNLAIFEAGISEPGEMENLEKVIQPDYGIFTNIGEAHQAHFSSLEEKAKEKLKLFRNCQVIVYCRDQSVVSDLITNPDNGFLNYPRRLIGWQLNGSSDYTVSIRPGSNGTILSIKFRGDEFSFATPFQDAASLENLSHCIFFSLDLGIDAGKLAERISRLHPVEMRLELINGINGCTIINDSYNSDLQSLSIALDALNRQNQHPRKTLILSDILESGRTSGELYSEVASLIKSKNVSRLIGIGPEISSNADLFDIENYFYPDTDTFLREHRFSSFSDEAILLKGSRPFGFEAIAQRLQQKAHNTVLEISLTAMVENLNVYRSLLKPATKIMAMVKAYSYGSGSYEIANVLQFHKVDYLGVAYPDEGVYLRRNGITLPILVMSPEESAYEAMIEYRLEPEIYSMEVLEGFAHALDTCHDGTAFPVHIKIDSGMHRLGFSTADIPDLAERLKSAENMDVVSIFTHIASADVPEHDEFTRSQMVSYEEAYSILSTELRSKPLRHALNSSGIARFPEFQYDMVRLGLGLYGLDPSGTISGKLRQVCTLKTKILQVKKLKRGDSVGYSRKGILTRDSEIATIGIGYADGFSRGFGNGKGKVFVKGIPAPVIGNVCMDMTMIDVTGIKVSEGDEVEVFGTNASIESLAESVGTIPYELLTAVSQRVKRIYYQE